MRPAPALRVFPVCIVFLCACATAPQDSVEPAFTLKQVGPNAWAAVVNPDAPTHAGANAGFVIGDDGVAVVDTFGNEEAATQLLAEIRKLTALPVRFVVNTHYHLDHVAGNRVFADAGAVVLAQRNVRDWIHPENVRLFGDEITPDLKASIEAYVAPSLVYEHGVDLYLGSLAIHVRSFPGHTGGDSVVLVPDMKTAFAGDLFWHDMVPNAMDASTRPWIDTLGALATSGIEYTFVPGHGDVGNAQDVAAMRDYLETLQKLVAAAQAEGRSGSALVEFVMPALAGEYGQLEFFELLAERNILDAEAESSGRKRVPQAR